MDSPELWFLFDVKHGIWPMGSKFDTDSRGLSPKATGLHLDGLGGDSLGSFPLVGPRSSARTADHRTLVSI